jgi:tight adherence protein B
VELIFLVLAGAAIPLGVLIAFSPSNSTAESTRAPIKWQAVGPKAAVAALVFILVVVVTGWIFPALLVGAVGWWATGLVLERDRRRGADLERVEALATWTEQLRDVLLAGDQPIGAIQATVNTAPDAIRPQVRTLAARLGRQSEQIVLRQWADALDDPTADLVAAGLLVALGQGARAEAVLTSLAAQARQQAERRRLLEAERAPVKREVWTVTGLMSVQLVGGLLFARSSYLAPYRTVSGQFALCLFLAIFLGLVVRVQRLSRFPKPARFLTLRGGAR